MDSPKKGVSMSKNNLIAIPVSVFVIVTLAACNLTGTPVVVSEPTVPLETLVAEAIASTAAAQTARADALESTQAAMATATPEFTFTPSLTPTAIFTPTPSVPMVSVSIATNCRSGPTTAYDRLGVLSVGEKAEVVGRSNYTDTLIIRLPSNPNITCWLWSKNATVTGDVSRLPLIHVPPTPTLAATAEGLFNVVYSSTITCGGEYMLKFLISNTGSLTWESNRIKATDQVTSEEKIKSRDTFPNFNDGCSVASEAQNLEKGEAATTTSGGFSADPSGHSIKATITVCTEDGMSGSCQDKTITFTP
jgi:hypothetical protein